MTILDTVFWLIWNMSAMACCENFPVSYRPLMATASSSVSLANPLFSPRRLSELFLDFLALSRLLSSLVPRNKWDGLTHFRLSHLCRTHIPSGISPTISVYATLWATIIRFLSGSQNEPYPLASLPAVHSQHSSTDETDTFDQNILQCSSDVIMLILYHDGYGNR